MQKSNHVAIFKMAKEMLMTGELFKKYYSRLANSGCVSYFWRSQRQSQLRFFIIPLFGLQLKRLRKGSTNWGWKREFLL